MADIDWRVWAKVRLDGAAPVTAIVPAASILGAGSIEENVKNRPFIIVKVGVELPGPFPGSTVQSLTLWVHDDPGDYMKIDSILKATRDALEGAVPESGGVVCRWMGDSVDLADEGFKTICRNQTFQLNGKDAANA